MGHKRTIGRGGTLAGKDKEFRIPMSLAVLAGVFVLWLMHGHPGDFFVASGAVIANGARAAVPVLHALGVVVFGVLPPAIAGAAVFIAVRCIQRYGAEAVEMTILIAPHCAFLCVACVAAYLELTGRGSVLDIAGETAKAAWIGSGVLCAFVAWLISVWVDNCYAYAHPQRRKQAQSQATEPRDDTAEP